MRFAFYIVLLPILLLGRTAPCFGQAGLIDTDASTAFDPQLDPNGDGYITASGAAFTSGTTELSEFELPTHIVGTWTEVFDINEAGSDITPSCGPGDIVEDADGGDIGYWTMTDPTPGTPRSGDEHLVLRMRLADRGSGNAGFNFLLSVDGLYGAGVDPNAVVGNQGFEYEIQFASGGGKSGVSGWDVDGLADKGTVNCNQCIAVSDVQKANAFAAGSCASGTPTFITFALPLSNLPASVGSDIDPLDLFIGMATAASGNQTSILGGGNVKDYGAFADNALPPDCASLTGAAQFDCLMEDAFVAQQAALPVTLLNISAERESSAVRVSWSSAMEIDFAGYRVERSTDGRSFLPLAFVEATGTDRVARKDYDYLDISAPDDQTVYYRLALVDLDGIEVRSRVVAVAGRATGKSTLRVYPNPVGQSLPVTIQLQALASTATLEVVDLAGRMLVQRRLAVGSQTATVDGLTKGLYEVRVVDASGFQRTRLLVQ